MTKIFIPFAIMALGVCSLAMASEYKTPAVGFRETEPSHKDIKMAEFDENFKMEGPVKPERQIASEQNPGDREPSSVIAEDKKPMEDMEMKPGEKLEPKPWLYRNKSDEAF